MATASYRTPLSAGASTLDAVILALGVVSPSRWRLAGHRRRGGDQAKAGRPRQTRRTSSRWSTRSWVPIVAVTKAITNPPATLTPA